MPKRFDPKATPAQRWDDDELQFMRLLGEFAQVTEGLTRNQYADLEASMDLTREEIDEIIERASDAWDRYKNTIP